MKKGLIIVLLIGVVVSLVGAGILAYAVAKDSFKYNKPSQTNIMSASRAAPCRNFPKTNSWSISPGDASSRIRR